MRNNRTERLVVWFTTTLVLLAVPFRGSARAFEIGATKQRRAPGFTLPDFQGKQVSLNDFGGQIVLLQFFQSGCPACRKEAPLLEQLYKSFKAEGVSVIGISHDSGGAEAVKQFSKEFEITYPLLLGDLEVAVRYLGITPQESSFDIPHLYLIDRGGTLVRDYNPSHDKAFLQDEKAVLEQAIQEVLAHSSAAHPPASHSAN